MCSTDCGILIIGIVLEAYSPLGNPTRPSKKDSEPVVMEDPMINEIAAKYSATPAQVSGTIISWVKKTPT